MQALLNPCKCELGGPCTCCQIKTKPRKKHSGHEFENPASAGATPPGGGCCGSSVYSRDDVVATRNSPTSINSSEVIHHPPQTAPMLHKTRLFSPYSTDLRRRDSSSSAGSKTPGWASPRAMRPPTTRIKPLTDMRRLMSAAVNQDGTLASEIPRSVVGLPTLPGIESFNTSANLENGEKSEDVDMPLAFPTSEDVVIGACMCGDDCSCPGCATHDHHNISSSNRTHDGSCGESCKGHHDCAHSIPIPSGVQSIAQLICIAASQVPPPPPNRTDSLNPHDTRILPPSVSLNEDAARTMGIVPLKPLECCGGQCRCPPGECTCTKQCCGCCGDCTCEKDEDTRMAEEGEYTEGAGDATTSSCGGCKGKEKQSGFSDMISPQNPQSLSPTSYHVPPLQPKPSNLPVSAIHHSTFSPSFSTPQPSPSTVSSPADSLSVAAHPSNGPNVRPVPMIQPRPILPKRASDTGLIMPQGSRPPSALGRSGSMTATKRSGTSTGVRRSNSDARKVVGPSQPHHLQSNQSPSDRSFYISSPQPNQIAPNGVPMASAPSEMAAPLNSADSNSDLLAFIQQQWSANKTSNSDMNPSEPAMPISVTAEPWAFPPQNETAEDSPPSDSFDLDAFLMSIGVQPDGELRNDRPPSSQPPQSLMSNIPPTQPIAPLPPIPPSMSNVRPGYDMTFANFFLNSTPSGPSGPSAVPAASIPSRHTTPQASRPLTPPEASFAEPPRWKFPGGLGGEIPIWKSPEVLQGFGVLGSPVLEKEEVGEENENGKDIIDLSKPLDSAALTKIMKALEKQGGGQSSSQGAPSVVNTNQQLQSLPALQTALPVHPASVISPTRTDSAHELDDMFSQFVTLDGTTGGSNNDGLGLNGGPGMMALATNMSLGDELGFGGEMRWDQARMWSN